LIVVDASAVGALVLREEHDEPAERIAALLAGALTAPPHFPVEVASLLLKGIRRGRIGTGRRPALFNLADGLVARVRLASPPSLAFVIRLSEQYGLSAYDASYLALSLTSGAPVLSVDGKLRRVAVALGRAA
jgi:predicted nucleic acid-binding protein